MAPKANHGLASVVPETSIAAAEGVSHAVPSPSEPPAERVALSGGEELPAEESFAVGVDGTRLYVSRWGEPSPLTAMLCDGLGCDGYIYKYLRSDLRGRFTIVHWHYRGHGRSASPVDPRAIGVLDHARDLDAVRCHAGDTDVVLFGHSFGVQVVLEAYRLRPDRVRALVLMCGAAGRLTASLGQAGLLGRVLPAFAGLSERHPRVARALWARVPERLAHELARAQGHVDRKALRREDFAPYFAHARRIDPQLFFAMLARAGEHSAEELLEEVAVPVLVVAGERDSLAPPREARRMASRFRFGECFVSSGATHVLPLERRTELAARLGEFFDGLSLC